MRRVNRISDSRGGMHTRRFALTSKMWVVALALTLGVSGTMAQVTWRTTHTTNSTQNSGTTSLDYATMRVKVNSSHLDVEEEVVIRTSGTVNAANDPTTLEIVANFSLPLGSTVTGALLWDGNRLLHAKLLDRFKADSIYEDFVDRDSIPPARPIDPLILERIGNSNFRLKVYPVLLNGTRRFRLRYQLPPRMGTGGFEVRLQSALIPLFTPGTATVPVAFVNGGGVSSVTLTESGVQRELILPRTLFLTRTSISAATAAHATNSTRISYSAEMKRVQFKTSFESGSFSGHYLNLYGSVDSALLGAFGSGSTPITSIVAVVRNTVTAYDFSVTCSGSTTITCGTFEFHGKSKTPWNDTLEWEAYRAGGVKIGSVKAVPTTTTKIRDTAIAQLWAGSASPYSDKVEQLLGPTYGFVDNWASLLALERDSLIPGIATTYADSGVPNAGPIPDYSGPVIGSWDPTSIRSVLKTGPSAWKLERMSQGSYTLRIPGLASGARVELTVFDLNGKRVGTWNLTAGAGFLHWNSGLIKPGTYVIQLKAPNVSGRKIMLL